MSLNVVILAAGKGTRMKSDLPKVLHPVAGKPMVRHVIDTAKQLQAQTVNVVYGYAGDVLQNVLKHEPVQWVEQAEQLGTGHAVRQALPNIADDDVVLVLYGDVPLIQAETLSALLASRPEHGLALLTVHLPDPTGYGRILRQDGQVCGIVEQKDATEAQKAISEVNSGIMAASGAQLKLWLSQLHNDNAQGEFYLTDIVAIAHRSSAPISTVHPATAQEIAGANDFVQLAQLERAYQYRQAERLMKQGVAVRDPFRVDIRGEVIVGKGVQIDVNVVFEGRVVLGDYVTIGPNCVLRDCLIRDRAVVDANNVLQEETVNPNVHIKPPRRF